MRFFCCALIAFMTGCFPYRQRWRPAFTGVVQREDGRAAANARVISCSLRRWDDFGSSCPRRAEVRADAAGRFYVRALRVWSWCCIGKAAFPITIAIACGEDGRVGATVVGSGETTIVLRSAEEAARRFVGPPGGTAEFFVHECRCQAGTF
jgi:hypothetical protein